MCKNVIIGIPYCCSVAASGSPECVCGSRVLGGTI